jgi:hypothetical protein
MFMVSLLRAEFAQLTAPVAIRDGQVFAVSTRYWHVLNPGTEASGWQVVPAPHGVFPVQVCAAPVVGHDERHDDPVSAPAASNSAQHVEPASQLVESPHVSRA